MGADDQKTLNITFPMQRSEQDYLWFLRSWSMMGRGSMRPSVQQHSCRMCVLNRHKNVIKSPNPETHICFGARRVFPALLNSPLLSLLERGCQRHGRTPPRQHPFANRSDLWLYSPALDAGHPVLLVFLSEFILVPPGRKSSPHHAETGEVFCLPQHTW